MKLFICALLVLALGNCLFENSKHITTLKWATFKKDVMESKDPWFLNFGSDKDPGSVKFAPIWEQAAETQTHVKYAYVNLETDQAIAKFFGLSGSNHQLFLCEEKPKPYGSPAFFSWPKDLKNVLNFGKNEMYVRKRQHIFRGTQYTQKLKTEKDLNNIVLKSKEPWFLLFCSEQEQQECLELVYQFDLAAQQLRGKVKFGLVDTYTSEITNVFGINGTGVCIYLGSDKPGKVGSPSLVGSKLKKKDYEKHVWDSIESSITDSAQKIVDKYPQIPEINYQQIMKHDGGYLVLFYSGSEIFGDDEQLEVLLGQMSDVKLSEKFKIGKMSVDTNKWIVGHLDIWPVPSIQYFPIKTKTAETIVLYEGDMNSKDIQEWAEEQLYDNIHDRQIILTRQNFQNEVLRSEEPWFIQFYTLNNNWCRKCAHLQPEWKKLSNLMEGQVKVAKLNCDIAKDICQQYEVFNFPKLLFFPKGKKSQVVSENVNYEGAFSKQEMQRFALDQFNIGELSSVKYLDTPETYKQYCTDFNGICFINVLPKDGNNQQYLDMISEVSSKLQKEPVSFLWIKDGDQYELQDRFELCAKGVPCTLGLDHRVDKELGFKVFFKKFSSANLEKQINELLSERRGFIPVKKALPTITLPGQSKKTDL